MYIYLIVQIHTNLKVQVHQQDKKRRKQKGASLPAFITALSLSLSPFE